ncbi:hypothetical protein PoB_006695500 [Plakobranchus ocellatus]|uniref:G-protein coupled receptors family 1 profile domain-containing protein n=1 Tax=Plakobranchus ocellatus TaxID=259542 RepID=A0AAV4D8K0_9GAST|nr:hypothetical protein PoB_006695500 [Plakobranchus ocellatus]
MSILTLVVSWNLQNKRLACMSFNRTYIEGFDITDTSELFNVSVPNKKKAPELHFFVKAIIWITLALIIFVLVQYITDFASSRTEEEATGVVDYICNSSLLLLYVSCASSVTATDFITVTAFSNNYSYMCHGYNHNSALLQQQVLLLKTVTASSSLLCQSSPTAAGVLSYSYNVLSYS